MTDEIIRETEYDQEDIDLKRDLRDFMNKEWKELCELANKKEINHEDLVKIIMKSHRFTTSAITSNLIESVQLLKESINKIRYSIIGCCISVWVAVIFHLL